MSWSPNFVRVRTNLNSPSEVPGPVSGLQSRSNTGIASAHNAWSQDGARLARRSSTEGLAMAVAENPVATSPAPRTTPRDLNVGLASIAGGIVILLGFG